MFRLCVLLLALILAGPAGAQTELLPGFPDTAPRGPLVAKGAVIWNHGKARLGDEQHSPIDGYTAILREAGWDIFRLNRAGMGDNQYDSPRALGEAVDRLHREGYGKIVLAGQSFGAWTSFLVGAKHSDLHAIVATAPAAYGTWDGTYGRYDRNASFLYDMVERINPTRVLVFFFAKDDFDPGGRGARLEAILRERKISHKIVDQPPDLLGHGSGHSHLFTRRYGQCIADFIDPDKDPDTVACEQSWGLQPTGEIPLPVDPAVTLPGPAVPPSLAALSGRWWGWYPNGREVEIVVTAMTADEAAILYGIGPGSDASSAASVTHRTAKPGEGGIVSEKPRDPTIILRPVAGGRATVIWKAADGRSSLEAVLQRLDP